MIKSDLLRIQEGKVIARGLVHSFDEHSYYYIFNSTAYNKLLQLEETDFIYSTVVFPSGFFHVNEIPAKYMTYRPADFTDFSSNLWLEGKIILHEETTILGLRLIGGKIVSHPRSRIVNCFLTRVELDRGSCKSCYHDKGEIGVKPYGNVDPNDHRLFACYLQDCIIERCITEGGILTETKRGSYLQGIESYDATSQEIISK